VVYIFLYLFFEVMVSTFFASMLGGFLTFFEIIASAIVGIYLLKNFQFSIVESGQKLSRGEITQEDFIKTNMAKAIGAILLIVPGFMTDIFGLLLQFGILTLLLTKLFSFKPKKEQNENQYNHNQFYYETNYYNQKRGNDEDIIDVEIIDDNKSINNESHSEKFR
jgi:UPF0716 family protein affecting phage T7 exclusion